MSDLKRTFLTGLLITVVLLFMPIYLNLIGYDNSNIKEPVSRSSSNQEQAELSVDSGNSNYLSRPQRTENNNQSPITSAAKAPDIITFNVLSDKYVALFSNVGGGSLIKYDLNENLSQYRGGYNDYGLFVDSIPVSLILNQDRVCSPCVGIKYKSDELVLLTDPFVLKTINGIPYKLNSSKKTRTFVVSDSLVFSFSSTYKGLSIVKTTTFYNNRFIVNHDIASSSLDDSVPFVALVWDKGLRNTEKNVVDEISYSLASVGKNKKIENISLSPSSLDDRVEPVFFDSVDWAAIRNKYFILAAIPRAPSFSSVFSSTTTLKEDIYVPSFGFSLGNPKNISADFYLGPLDVDYINSLDTYLDRIMNFGWFILQPFSRSVLWLLKFLHSFGINYGLILIFFAFMVRIITGPLTKKSYESTQKMQSLQPRLQALQKKHKSNSQKLNQETVKLYKESGTNPLGGCLPMLLQMPLLFALFIVFRSTIEFRGAPFFGWISDLSQPDTLFDLPFYVPIYGDQVAFLPILLGITMFLSQRISSASMDSKQKPLMYMMTAFFYLIFNSFPSGLNLYYVVYNILNYFQQKSLKKT